MTDLEYIDQSIVELLEYMLKLQNQDGSFDTMFYQPYYHPEKGWMKWHGNSACDTASSLIPLLYITSPLTKILLDKGCDFLLKSSLDNKFWRFAGGDGYIIPFDTESTSFSSFVITKHKKIKIKNKHFINSFINRKKLYSLYFFPVKLSFRIPVHTLIRLHYKNLKSSSETHLKVFKDDWEFATTCNNLLYIGKMKKNEKTWDEIKVKFDTNNIKCVYFNVFYNIYSFARLSNYGFAESLLLNKENLIKCINDLYLKLDSEYYLLNRILLINTILFFGLDLTEHKVLLNQCFKDVSDKLYTNQAASYSSNSIIDIHLETKIPNTFFGSLGINCSLYLEFLNLYRKQVYGSYYR